MSWHWSGTSLLLLAGAGYLTACAVYVWRYRRGPTAASLVVVLAALAQWGVARAGALAAGDPAIKRVFCDLKYVGLVVLAPAAIVFVLQHAGRLRRPSPLLLGLLAVEPLVILLALAIPSPRHLLQTCLPSMAPDAAPMVRYGPLFWVHFVYFNAATWLCLAAFVVTMARTSRPYRRQNAILLGSLALPLGANLLTLLNFGPFGWVDLPPFAFLLTVVFLGLAVFRFHLLDLRPIARSRIFQTIGEGVVVLDLGGKVIDANVAAERLLGLPLARIVGQPARRVLPAWAGVVQDQLALGDGEAIEEIEMGTSTHEVTVSSLTDHLGWPTGQLVVARDVTERRRVEQQLRDSLEREQASTRHLRALDQMKSTFLQAVSHDLRNPLASVLGIAITLQRRHLELGRDDVADLLHRLSRSARKMDRLLNDLLDLDRLAQPTVTPERECVDLGELVARVVKETTAELLERRPVHVEVCPLLLEVDPPKVERIVENLLANAARHTPSGTPVWVRVQPRDHGALLVVEDAGPGVPEQLRETIFEPFRQGPAPASHAPGLGVGLALVRVFAQLHGGSAWVEERQGRGASFRVHLPGGRPVAQAVVGCAEVRAALDHLARDVLAGLAGRVAALGAVDPRVAGDAARPGGLGGMAWRVEVAGPLPDVAGHVVQAVAVGAERPDGRGPRVPVALEVLPGELALPGVGHHPSLGRELVAPAEDGALQATAGGTLPLRLGRKLRSRPGGVGLGVMDDRVALASAEGAAGPLRAPPARPRDPRPPVAVVAQVDRSPRGLEHQRARHQQRGVGVRVVRRVARRHP